MIGSKTFSMNSNATLVADIRGRAFALSAANTSAIRVLHNEMSLLVFGIACIDECFH